MVTKRFRDSLIRVEQVGTDSTPEFEIRHSRQEGFIWLHESITLNLPEAEALVELLQVEIQKAKQKMEELGV